jgi:uncharacterized protein (TIGR03663 family)
MAGLFLAAAIALALRCPQLGERPMHNDEAVNAIKFRSLQEQGSYRFDPNEHHGPALFYCTLAWTKLTHAPQFADFTEARLRTVTVLFGVGLILLLPLVADGLGRKATIFAALLTAISPALVYYNRDYIHESLLVFFTFLALAGGWRYHRSRNIFWAILTGGAIGLMQSTKETFVLALAAAAVALVATGFLERRKNRSNGHVFSRINFKHLLLAFAVWGIVVILFYSSFFTNAAGPLDALRTYLPWTGRAAGNSPHIHPWYFYLERLLFFQVRNGPLWTEGWILGLALVGMVTAFTRHSSADSDGVFLRFLSIYTLILTVIYCMIPYKTPWCLLGFWHGMILLAGAGVATAISQSFKRSVQIAVWLALFAIVSQLIAQAWLAAGRFSTDRRNPYVYAQTSPDILTLAGELDAIARSDPADRHLLIKIMAPGSDYWPLPWYLRKFDQVGWWSDPQADPPAPVMIVSTKFQSRLETNDTHVAAGMFELRPDNFVELYVQSNLWRTYVESRNR